MEDELTEARQQELIRLAAVIAAEYQRWPFVGNTEPPRHSRQRDGGDTSLCLGVKCAEYAMACANDLHTLANLLLNESVCGLPEPGEEYWFAMLVAVKRLTIAARRVRRQCVVAKNRWHLADRVSQSSLKAARNSQNGVHNGQTGRLPGLPDAELPF